MKKINTYIDYGKFAIVIILFLIGSMSEFNIYTLAFLLSALVFTFGVEAYLLHTKRLYIERYEKYLNELDKAIKEQIRDDNAA